MILKCIARCRCSVEVAQEKVIGLYTRRSLHSSVFTLVGLHTRRLIASIDASASALGHQINTQSKRLECKQLWPAFD